LHGGLHRRGLSARVRDGDRIRHVVDDDCIVNVVVDDVVRRRSHVSRRTHPNRHGPVNRHRQQEDPHRRRRRFQHDEFGWGRRQEEDRHRRWWREAKYRIVEYENRPANVNDLLRGRRWQIVSHHREGWRRLECGSQKGEAPTRVTRVRTIRIASQIGPVGGRRIDDARASPCDRLAPGRNDGAHPPSHGIVGVNREKVGVSFQRVALECHDIRLLRIKIANWPRADRRRLFSRNRGGWGIGCPLEEHERRRYFRGMPWHLCAFSHVIDAQSCTLEDVGKGQTSFADHLSECLGIWAIGALPFGSHRPGRRIEREHHARLGLDECQTAGEPSAGAGERIGTRRIEHNNAGLKLHRRKRPDVIGNSKCLSCNIRIARNARIDRNEIILALELDAIAAGVDEGDSVRSRSCRFLHEVAKGVTQRVLIEVASAHDVETRGLESLRNQAGVVGRSGERSCLVARVPNDERDALFRLCRARDADQGEGKKAKSRDKIANARHEILERKDRLQSFTCLWSGDAERPLNRRGQELGVLKTKSSSTRH